MFAPASACSRSGARLASSVRLAQVAQQARQARQARQLRSFSDSSSMSGAASSAALYALTASTITSATAPASAQDRKHHLKDGKGFTNPWDSWHEQSGPAVARAMIGRRLRGKANQPDTRNPDIKVQKPAFLPTRQTRELRATWLGHACYYVEFPGGLRVLCDPVFTERCSPMSFLGPKRYTPVPCEIEDIPYVDIVVISHSHYDHLSHPTIMRVHKRFPDAHYFVPLGNKSWFHSSGIDKVTELDWWDVQDVKLSQEASSAVGPEAKSGSLGVDSEPAEIFATLGFLPCQHTTARTGFDKGQTLWGSWSIESGGRKLWFGGDSGYRAVPEIDENDDQNADYGPEYANLPTCPAFRDIGEHRGPFDLGLIPIGAYAPRFIMSPMHANPYDSVNIFLETRCRRALAMHWGTWVLTEEDVLEPPKLLKKALAWKSVPETGVFDVCAIGESREFEQGGDKADA